MTQRSRMLVAVAGATLCGAAALIAGRFFEPGVGAAAFPFAAAAAVAVLAYRALVRFLPDAKGIDSLTAAHDALADAERYIDYEVIRNGPPDAPAGKRLVDDVRQEVDRLRRGLNDGTLAPRHVSESAQRLARIRVYLFPKEQLEHLTLSITSDFHQFGVPEDVIQQKLQLAKAVRGPSLDGARSAAEELLAEHEYWGHRLDTWGKLGNQVAVVGLPVALATLYLSVQAIEHGEVVIGFILAGAAGAAASVMQRLPGISVVGKTIDFWARAAARYVTGVVAAAVGLGVLLTGILNPFGQALSFTDAVQACSTSCAPHRVGVFVGLGAAFGFTERFLTTLSDTIAARMSPGRSKRTEKNATRENLEMDVQ